MRSGWHEEECRSVDVEKSESWTNHEDFSDDLLATIDNG